MVVTDLRPNLIKITRSIGYATLNPDAKDIRRVIAEDEEWNLSTIPLLKDLTLDHIVKNFKSLSLNFNYTKGMEVRFLLYKVMSFGNFSLVIINYFLLLNSYNFLQFQ